MAEHQKKYAISADQIRPIAVGNGACIATDMIMVEGRKVGYMYREKPNNGVDSGWRFMSGYETQEYMDNASNLSFYDVNTVANYDPDIIPHLRKEVGSAFEREGGIGPFVAIDE